MRNSHCRNTVFVCTRLEKTVVDDHFVNGDTSERRIVFVESPNASAVDLRQLVTAITEMYQLRIGLVDIPRDVIPRNESTSDFVHTRLENSNGCEPAERDLWLYKNGGSHLYRAEYRFMLEKRSHNHHREANTVTESNEIVEASTVTDKLVTASVAKMKSLPGTRLTGFGRVFKHVRDIVYFDGPLMSEFKYDNKTYIFHWVDCDGEANRWMIYRVDPFHIGQFERKEINASDLVWRCLDGFVLFFDAPNLPEDVWFTYEEAFQNCKDVSTCRLINIPKDYLPAPGYIGF